MKNRSGKIINSLFTSLLIFALFSCGLTKSLYVEFPEKSAKELPENIQSLLLVARVVDDGYTNLKTDSLQKIFYRQEFNYDTIINDIQAVDTTLKAIGELLFESGRYDFVIPENRFPDYKKNAFITGEMSWDEVKALCDTFKTDAVVSIDHFRTRVITTYNKEDYFVPFENTFSSRSTATMKVGFETVIRIYDPAAEKIRNRFILRDTLYWEDSAADINELFGRFTPVKQALTETGVAVALELSHQISPVWHEEKRWLYESGGPEMKKAAQLARSGQWEQAVPLWKKTAENSKSKSLKSKAEFNLALAYEMLDDLETSISWALKSYETMYRTNTYNYLELLKNRKSETDNH